MTHASVDPVQGTKINAIDSWPKLDIVSPIGSSFCTLQYEVRSRINWSIIDVDWATSCRVVG